jgi:Cys-tRNA(Pro)/Cys-tRNA(Cys) deacylase
MIMNNELADELAPGVRRMLAAAAQRGISVELRHRPAANSLEEAAELLGIHPSDIAKTIVLRHSRGSYLFALIPGDTQIAWPKLRSLLGVSKMKLPDAAEALEATGYERGTITPIGSEQSWPVIIDQRLAGHRAALGGWRARLQRIRRDRRSDTRLWRSSCRHRGLTEICARA